MSHHPSLQPEPLPGGEPVVRARRLTWLAAVAFAVCTTAACVWLLGTYLSRRAEEAVEQLLSSFTGVPVTVERVYLDSPARVVLEGVDAGPLRAEEVHLDLSIAGLIRRDPYRAVEGVSLIDGRLALDGHGDARAVEIEGHVALRPQEDGLLAQVLRGTLTVEEAAWTAEGEAALSTDGLSRLKASLTPKDGTSGRFEIDLTPSSFGTFEVWIKGEGISLPALWALVLPFLPQEAQGIPAPEGGVLGVDVRAVAGRGGVESARGDVWADELLWHVVASARAGISGTYTRQGAAGRAGEGGEAEGGRAGQGPGRGFHASAGVRIGPGALYHHAIRSLEGQIEATPAGWRFEGEALGERAAVYRLEASGRGRQADVVVLGEQVPASEAILWVSGGAPCPEEAGEEPCAARWPLRFRAAGSVSGTVQVDVGPAGSRTSGRVDVGGTWLGTTRIAEGSIDFSAGGGEVELTGALSLGGGRLAGRLAAGRALSGEIELEDVSLPAIETLAKEAGFALPVGRWRGRASGRIVLEGSAAAPQVGFDIVGIRAGALGVFVDRVEVSGAWQAGLWEIDSAAAQGPGDLRLSARGKVKGPGGVDVELEWSALSLRWLAPLFPTNPFGGLDAKIDGRSRLWDDGAGLEISGRATATGEAGGYQLDAGIGLDGRVGGLISLDGTVTTAMGSATVRSQWTKSRRSVSVALEQFPLAALAGLFGWSGIEGDVSGSVELDHPSGEALQGLALLDVPKLVVGGVGIAEARAELDLVDGSPEAAGEASCAPCLFGQGRVTGRIEPSQAGQRASDLELVAEFRGDEAELVPVSLPVWGGRASLAGGARQEDGVWRLDLRSQGSGLRYDRFGVAATFDYRASLAGPLDALKATVQAEVKSGQVDLFQLPRGFAAPSAPARSAAGRFEYDVELDVTTLRLMARSLLNGEVTGSVRLAGRLGQLQATGEMSVLRGYFGYLGRRFEIERGRASFQGTSLIPILEVTGSARVQGVTLHVDASGPADDLSLSARSDPPVDSETLRELMMEPLGGTDGLSGDWGTLASILATVVNRQVVSEVYWSLGRALEDALDIDLVEIARSDGEALELRLGKYVTPELYLAYRRNLSGQSGQAVSLEYSLGRRFLLRTTWDRERGSLLDAGVSLPF